MMVTLGLLCVSFAILTTDMLSSSSTGLAYAVSSEAFGPTNFEPSRKLRLHDKSTTPPVGLCGIDGYDYYNLTKMVWQITLKGLLCVPDKENHTLPDTCEILLALCQPVGDRSGCLDTSLCQSSKQGNLSVGSYVDQPFQSSVPSGYQDGFKAILPNGSPYTTNSGVPCVLHSEVDFICDPSQKWLQSSDLSRLMSAPEPVSVSYEGDSCKYSMQFKYAGACKQSSGSRENMSAGTMLIVIFSVTLILYFTFGCMINIAKGKQGSEMIPHPQFWKMLPVYIMDGIRFTFSCGKLPVTKTYEEI